MGTNLANVPEQGRHHLQGLAGQSK